MIRVAINGFGRIGRLAFREFLTSTDFDIVAINEAVELAKAYSDDKVKNMINGVLDNIYHSEVEDER